MSDNHIRSTLSDEEIEDVAYLSAKSTREDKNTSLETPSDDTISTRYTTNKSPETLPDSHEFLDEENNRYSRSNPFLTSSDTDWIDALYKTVYPLPVSKRHKDTFKNIITNLSLRKTEIYLQLNKNSYKDTYLPKYFAPTPVSDICRDLEIRGYIKIERGHKYVGSDGVATTIEPTEKLLSLIPDDMSYEIMDEGLVIPKEFTYDIFPQSALDTRALLSEYNKTVEPENMLYASHKGGFEINGRFTGSSVCIMKKEDRKNILIDGEPTVELDISNCLPFLLYASELGDEFTGPMKIEDMLSENTTELKSKPRIDAYEIEGIPRKLVKKAFMMAINTTARSKARSAIQYTINSEYTGQPYKASYILDQIERAHPELVDDYLYKGLGARLMYLESQSMAKFMRAMLDRDIKFYPIYDSVRVPVSSKDIVEEQLRKAFAVNGIEPEIHED